MTSITPAEGTLDGGTAVVLKGSRFAAGATVAIGVAATAVEVVSETEIRAKTAADAEGKYEVVVQDKYGVSTGGPKYTYTPPVWSVQEFQPLKELRMNAVSCVSGSSCRAVGSYNNGNIPPQTQAATGVWNGTGWTAQEPPLPAEVTAGKLSSVSCSSTHGRRHRPTAPLSFTPHRRTRLGPSGQGQHAGVGQTPKTIWAHPNLGGTW